MTDSDGTLEREQIKKSWNELLELTKGEPKQGDILGIVHVLRVTERRLGMITILARMPK